MNRKMMRASRSEYIEDVVIIAGLLGLQIIYAGNLVLLSDLMLLGFTTGSLVILSSLATFVIVSPFAVIFKRALWPKKLKLNLWIKLVLISFGGVTLSQPLFLKGMSLTSPAIGTAMPNLAPGFIFFIAWAFSFLLEKVELSCRYSKAKILGTLLCVVGAVIMSLMQNNLKDSLPRETHVLAQPSPSQNMFDGHKIIGCMYLMVAVLLLSSTIVLQATALSEFPAPMSLSAITSFIGVILTGTVQLMQNGRIETGWPLISFRTILYSLAAGTIGGVCVSFNAWAMKKRGPVLVSIFNPIGTVIALILSLITLGSTFTIGSLARMLIMFAGLYTVLWAKAKEKLLTRNGDISSESGFDVERPLLS